MDSSERKRLQMQLDGINPEVGEDLKNFLKKAANQRIEEKKGVEQAANQEGKKLDKQLIEMDGKLKSQVEDLQKIHGVPKPDIEDLKKTAQNIPELKGANPEDIKLGKYNNILVADFYVRNSADITKGLNPDNAKKFQESVGSLSKTLGRVQFESLIINKVLGPDREKIESRGRELIEKGYNKEVVWNPADRTITFTNKNGDIRVIETARIPPREAIEKNGLRIGRDIEPVSKEEQQRKEAEKNLANKKGSREKAESTYFETGRYNTTNTKILNNPELSKNPDITRSMDEKTLLIKEYKGAKDTKTKKELITKILEKVSGIEKSWRANIGFEDTLESANGLFKEIEGSIEMEKIDLNTINKALSDELQAEQELPPETITKKPDTTFESNAAYNLNFLSYIGYDGLGQDGLERIIERLNSPSNPRRSELGEIRLGDKLDTPQTQALTLAIANIVRGGRQSGTSPTPEQAKQEKEQKTWDGVDKTDPIIAARQTRSFGFRDSLISVRRNMTQEGGSLKTRGQLDKALFGIEPDPEVNNSAENTATPAESMTSFA